MMNALEMLVGNGLSDETLNAVLEDLLEADAFDDEADKLCCIALAWCRDDGDSATPSDCTYERDNTVNVHGREYLVLTDDEADTALDDYLEQLLDEPEMVPGADSPYFDREAWKKDAKIDGRGHFLSGYDSNENEYSIDCNGSTEWYYLYRIN